MKRTAFLFVMTLALAVAAGAQGIAVGSKVENFSLPDLSGKVQTLDSLKGKNGAVLVFVSQQCPVVRQYNERMNQIAADYNSKGIAFIGINSNATEMSESGVPFDSTKEHHLATYKFPVVFDKGNVLADKLGATKTPEVYFVDAKNVLLYQGAIDNDRSGMNVSQQYLRSAFDAALSGAKIERTSTTAFGCTIKRAGKSE
jgi:thiol-disulfide isomerase/thioredoxin